MKRRKFLTGTGKGAAAVGLTLLANAKSARSYAANDRVQVAQIGCGGRGRYNAYGIIEAGGVVTRLCDLHAGELAKTAEFIAGVQRDKPRFDRDIEETLGSANVDAVVIATPDHWHSPMSILACQAGKDVYVEKPHSHNIWESRMVVQAARKYGRIVQIGTQNRSGAYTLAARDYIKSGKLGKIHLVKVYNLKSGRPFHMGAAGQQPEDFNWDAWLGPAPRRPWHQKIFNGGWHQFWNYTGGGLSNDGIHQLDLALMLLGDPGMPKRVSSAGGRYAHRGDDSQVPDTHAITYEFDNFIMTYEHSLYPKYMQKTTATIRRNDEYPYWTQNATRIEFYGSEHMMTVGRHGGGWQVTQSGGRVLDQMYGRPCDHEHYANFLECIKTRKRANADCEIAHTAATMVHMSNIAHRAGNTTLEWDAKKERFKGNKAANGLVKRTYRKNYEVPEEV